MYSTGREDDREWCEEPRREADLMARGLTKGEGDEEVVALLIVSLYKGGLFKSSLNVDALVIPCFLLYAIHLVLYLHVHRDHHHHHHEKTTAAAVRQTI